MEKNHKNPNSWLELPQDLVISVFERLGFADFKRAKSVCSSWHSASRHCVPKNKVPWLILFPEDNNDTSLTLFNPEEKDKLYKTQALGDETANRFSSRATYGSWLLKQNLQWNLYIVNIFTHEIIYLPPMESQLGVTKVERTATDALVIFDHVDSTYKDIFIRFPVFWIDEKTKEYIVLCALDQWCVVYSKNGDKFWNQVPELSNCCSMIYKDHKLHFISYKNTFTIFDFSGQIPQQTFHCSMLLNTLVFDDPLIFCKRFVVTVTGDVLIVEELDTSLSHICIESFRIFKIYSSSSGFLKKYERVEALGDETMLLDLGITVLATKVEGLQRNSIYFSGYYYLHNKDLLIINLETQKMERLNHFDVGCSLSKVGDARWFLPSF